MYVRVHFGVILYEILVAKNSIRGLFSNVTLLGAHLIHLLSINVSVESVKE